MLMNPRLVELVIGHRLDIQSDSVERLDE